MAEAAGCCRDCRSAYASQKCRSPLTDGWCSAATGPLLDEQIARLDGAAQQRSMWPSWYTTSRRRRPRSVAGSALGERERLLEHPQRLVERVAARDLVREVDEIGEGAARLVGAAEVIREPVVHLVEAPRVHRLDRLADRGVDRLAARAEQVLIDDLPDARVGEVEALAHARRRCGGAPAPRSPRPSRAGAKPRRALQHRELEVAR